MIELNRLTHQLILQVKSLTQDAELNGIETWTTWRTVWCQPLEKTSREFYRLSTVNAEITEAFRIRYIAGITARHRIKFMGRYYEIIGEPVNEGERNISLILTCKGAS